MTVDLASFLDERQAPAVVKSLVRFVLEENPLHAKFLLSALGHLDESDYSDFEKYLAYCLAKGLSVTFLAESYLFIVDEMMREQLYFRKHGSYRYSSYAEVADSVYMNSDYMSKYMYGLAISGFFWPNHIAIRRFFATEFCPGRRGNYLEVGPGHGWFLSKAMEVGDFDRLTGVDLSTESVNQTASIIDYFHNDQTDRIDLHQADFLEADTLVVGGYDAIVLGEVVEHVEHPELFLRRARDLAAANGSLFVTTCMNAPAVDHIFLWRDVASFENLLAECGLKIVNALRLPYEGKTLEESLDQALPVNVAYVLEVDD